MRVKVSFASFPIFAICLLAKGAKVSVKINVKNSAQVLQKFDANHLGRQPLLRNAPIMPNHLGRRQTLGRGPRISKQSFLAGTKGPLALSPGFVSDVVDYSVPENPFEAQGTRQGQQEEQGTLEESQNYFVDASDSKVGCGVAPLRYSSASQNNESNGI